MLYAVTLTHPWPVAFPIKTAENRPLEPPADLTYLAIHAGRKPNRTMLQSVLEDTEYIVYHIIDDVVNDVERILYEFSQETHDANTLVEINDAVLEEIYCLSPNPTPAARRKYPSISNVQPYRQLERLLLEGLDKPELLYPTTSAVIGVMKVEQILPPISNPEHKTNPWQSTGSWSVVGQTIMLEHPVQARGNQHFWKLPQDVLNAVRAEYRRATQIKPAS